MSASAPRRMYRLFDFIPHVVSCISVVVGVVVLIGWEFDVATLKSIFSGLTVMKVNTAVGFILAGAALWSHAMDAHSRAIDIAAQVCASIISLLGLATLFEYLSGVNFGIDQFLVREITHLPGDIPGRMALNTALSFAAVGSALLLVSLRRRQLIVTIHALVLVPLIAAGSALIGYAYDIEGFLREKLDYTPMALHTANVFVLLALGVMTARADYPLRRFLRSTNPAGVMVRQLLPVAIVLTLLTGWLILRGFHAGHFGATFALGLFTAVTIIWLGGLILWGARTVYQAAVQRERMEESLRSASQYARSLIEASPDPLVTISAGGKITDVNEATVKATGVAREALIGRDFSDYFTEPDKARAGYQEVFAKGFVTDYPLSLQHVSGKVMEVLYNASVYRDATGEVAGVFAAARDITERKKNEAVNAVRLRLMEFSQTHTLDELLEETLNEAERLTGSLIGFYHFVEEDQNSLTLQTWSTRTKTAFCKAEGKGLHYPIADAGVWADCERQGKPVIQNDDAELPNRNGIQEGHSTLI
ncbi:MAG: PAS domain S-box protein, partial [Sulfuricella sp.]